MHHVKRTILVTGASSGIGQAVARELLSQGHCVIGTSRDCSQFNTSHSGFYPSRLDLNHPEEIFQWARQLGENHPALDAVVFSAGYGRFGSLEEFSLPQIERMMTVNFTAQAVLTRALLPGFKKKPNSNLIYIGSEAALQGRRKGSIYCASKFALRGFTQALRDECGKSSVRISLINPGMVNTAFFDELSFMPGDRKGQFLKALDVADAVIYILNAGGHMVIDELNLTPACKVFSSK